MEPIKYFENTNKEIPFEHRMLGVIRGFDKLVKKLAECRKQRDDFRTKYLDLLAWKKPTYDYAKELKELDDKIKKRKKHLEAVDRSIAEKNEECKNLKARKETLREEVRGLLNLKAGLIDEIGFKKQ